jgi:diguanylate cyclase (GGDEF)-like protein
LTLRTRLTLAFLAVVLGPVLLGAVIAGAAVTAIGDARRADRLDHGAAAVQTAIMAQCQRLFASARAVALLTQGGTEPEQAQRAVDEGLADNVRLDDVGGLPLVSSDSLPPQPWAVCGQGGAEVAYGALAARVELRSGEMLRGYAYAAEPVDADLLAQLSSTAGVSVTLHPATPYQAPEATPAGRVTRRLDPGPDQPLPLLLSVPSGGDGLGLVLLIVIGVAGLASLALARRLAHTTTRPLAELATAVERVGAGDLDVRAPVHGADEVGRLATAVNSMTVDLRSHVRALTASRDALRESLVLLGDTLSSTHDLDRIFEVILRTAMGATSATAGVLLLASGDVPGWPRVLEGRCALGLTGPAPLPAGDIRVRIGEGVLGAVAASGEALRGRFERAEPFAPVKGGPVQGGFGENEPRCTSFVAVPFTGRPADEDTTGATRLLDAFDDRRAADGGSQLLGVLALYDRVAGGDFDDDDIAMLRTFGAQAGVAVENVLLHQEARRLSVTDPLTGLWNYRHLRESLRVEVERAARFGRQLGVLVLDLDHFKGVNDTYGHRAGDAVLAEVARRLRSVIREVDLAFRYGGEEFVVLLPETDALGGITLAQRLAAAVRNQPFLVPARRTFAAEHQLTEVRPGDDPEVSGGAHPGESGGATAFISVTVSIGIAVYPEHAGTGSEVLDVADEALYAAKAAGRDTFLLAPGDSSQTPDSRGTTGLGGVAGATHPPRQSRGG